MSKPQANKLTKRKILGALAAGAASVYAQSDAEAGIVWTGASGNAISGETVLSGDNATDTEIFWDIDGDGTNDARIVNSTEYKNLNHNQGKALFVAFNLQLALLSPSQTVGNNISITSQLNSQLNFRYNVDSVFVSGIIDEAQFTDRTPGYFGFKLLKSGSTYYGWAKATLTEGTYGEFSITEWAYNDVAGASITVGDTGNSAVPEPSSFAITGLGLLAAGAGGVRRWRREKKVKAA